jgi:hypothetical protein
MTDRSEDREALDSFAKGYRPASTPDEAILHLDRWWIESHVQGPRVLELGASDGTSTLMLLAKASELDVVEGAARYCELIRQRVNDPRVSVFHSLFEEFEPDRAYEDVVIARSLDYVEDPVALLRTARTWIEPGGRLHIVVQNAASLHRRLGVALGLMPSITYLNDSSRAMGHRRVYTYQLLQDECRLAGYDIELIQGYFLKPFDYATLQGTSFDLATKLFPALFEVGWELPDDLCSQLYALCRPGVTPT